MKEVMSWLYESNQETVEKVGDWLGAEVEKYEFDMVFRDRESKRRYVLQFFVVGRIAEKLSLPWVWMTDAWGNIDE